MSAMCAAPPAWESGKPIPVGAAGRLGPLGIGLTSFPAGWANVTGAKRPDLFAVAGRLSFPTGLFLYPYKSTTAAGVPVFGQRIEIAVPLKTTETPKCTVVQTPDAIWGFFLDGAAIIEARFDKEQRAFNETRRIQVTGLAHPPAAIAALAQPGSGWTFILSVPEDKSYPPPGAGSRHPDYVPYDGAGIWRGGMTRFALWSFAPGQAPKLLSRAGEGILWNPGTLSFARFGASRPNELISGSWFGDIYYYTNKTGATPALGGRLHAVDPQGIALRHPLAGCYPLAYPGLGGAGDDMIAGGEGALYYYKFTGRFDKQGRPVYERPVPVLQDEAKLFAGTLAVPTIVDWDGDGALDIVAGNSEGRILFFRNLGTSRAPALAPGVPLSAGGREIHIQPGYKGDIQGPGEARWGYVSPNVFDWNLDGLPDILASDSTARHYVYLNTGTRRVPKLAHDQTIYFDGLDLHGTWRVRPGVAKWGGRAAYVALDDQDEFHLYWRIDNFNVADGGKLRMEDGTAIRANFIFAGGTGRSKIELTDWDGDGIIDLLVGTPKHHSIPNPETGLPRALGMPGTMILFLKNTGTNEAPKFRFPAGLKHDGENIYLGHHEIGATTGPIGPGKGSNVVVSREDGRLLFFQRERMKD